MAKQLCSGCETMMPNKHLAYAVLASTLLYVCGVDLFPLFIFIMSSVLIDIDHAFDYLFKFKNYSWNEAKIYFKREGTLKRSNEILPVFIFHNIETLLVLLIASFFYPIFIFIYAGIYLHLFLDWKVMPANRHPIIIKLSLMLVLIENYRRKRGIGRW